MLNLWIIALSYRFNKCNYIDGNCAILLTFFIDYYMLLLLSSKMMIYLCGTAYRNKYFVIVQNNIDCLDRILLLEEFWFVTCVKLF